MLLHVGASVLVLLIARQVLGAAPGGESWGPAPLAAGLLFATHPIHTEAVAWAAGVADVSCAFFYLLALYLYILPGSGRRPAGLVSVVAFFLALLSKEPAVTLPLVLVAWDGLLRQERFSAWKCGRRLLPYLAAAGVYLALRVRAVGEPTPLAGEAMLGPYQYVINVLALLAGYLEALVWPVNLNFWRVFEPLTTLASPPGLRVLAVVVALAAAVMLALRHSRPALFALILVVVPLLPAFHLTALNQGIENAFAERYLYLPSAGFVLVVGACLDWIRRRRPRAAEPSLVAVGLLVSVFAVGTVRRNMVWKDAYTLWSDTILKSPGSAVAQMNYGFSLIARGRVQEGREHLRLAHQLDPSRTDLKIQNAIAYARLGRHKEAMLELHAALELDAESAPAHYNLALVYEYVGCLAAAIEHYERALALSPGQAHAHNNVGILFAKKGDTARAAVHFEAAMRLDPRNPDYRVNLERLRNPG